MIKKIATIAGAGAMLLATATPAMANFWLWGDDDTSNTAVVTNTASASSNTGYNEQINKAYGGGWFWGGDAQVHDNGLVTGDAWADAKAVTIANTAAGCGCELDGDVTNTAVVTNSANASSNTGFNYQYNKAYTYKGDAYVYDNALLTGNAGAEADAWTVVNTDLSGFAF